MTFEIHHHYHFPDAGAVLEKLEKILKQGEKIMLTVQEYADKVNANFDTISKGVDGIAGDVTALKAEIQTLKDSLGQLTPEADAALAAVLQRSDAIAARVTDLDAQTENAPAP